MQLHEVIEILAKHIPWTASDADDAEAVFSWIKEQREPKETQATLPPRPPVKGK